MAQGDEHGSHNNPVRSVREREDWWSQEVTQEVSWIPLKKFHEYLSQDLNMALSVVQQKLNRAQCPSQNFSKWLWEVDHLFFLKTRDETQKVHPKIPEPLGLV